MKLRTLVCFTLIFLCAQSVSAQFIDTITGIQDSLSRLSSQIWKQKSDSAQLKSSEIFFNRFYSVLKSPSSAAIPLDSIYGITRVSSDDRRIRIFTWNVPLASGTNKYFGFIQFYADSLKVVPLRSTFVEPDGFDAKQVSSQYWYGALYYKLIEVKSGEQKYFTVLGWDGFTSASNRKIIDIINFDKSGNISFGMPIFKTDLGLKTRVVKEYAEKANMLLKYDYQSIRVKKGKKIKKEDTWLIVMDRLVPMDPSLSGIQKYYVASGDTYDGYIFRDGFWILVEDVDVANRILQ